MTTPYKCKECLYYYRDYFLRYREGHNWCNWKKREVNPDYHGCSDFVLPTMNTDIPYRENNNG